MKAQGLPVEGILEQLREQLAGQDAVVLQAPPGAGKTTLVPLALMQEPWLHGKKILMLEPRRIATRTAAHRMASLIGETPGERVGYRMRLESRVGPQGRIEVITEGILTRMLQQDPSLEDIGLVIFDEYHERSLESDLALALCLKGRSLFRNKENPLKILVMSATLDGEAVAGLLDAAPLLSSEGRAFPVEIIYGAASKPREAIVERMLTTIKQALQQNPASSLLAFLPGQGEIRRVNDALASWLLERKISGIHLRPLYGNLSIEQQQLAIAPLSGADKGEQKVVLATNIAETSLTIEGVDLVVDSGLAREARFDPNTGMTALHTLRISAASAEQRAGRAGRLRPGKCYRLWSAAQQQQLAPHSSAEILSADLAPLALQLLHWGIDDPLELRWLDPPPTGPWHQALELLAALGAIETRGQTLLLSAHGEAMALLPLHPRLAHMLLRGREIGATASAALLASLLSERDPFAGQEPDVSHRLDMLSGETACPAQQQGWLRRTRQMAQQIERQLRKSAVGADRNSAAPGQQQLAGYLLACAYPERIARRRNSGSYQLANGRSASLDGAQHLGNQRWLAVAEVSGIVGGKGDIIRSAAALDEALFDNLLADSLSDETIAEWDKQRSRFVAEQQKRVGALVLQRRTLDEVPFPARRAALIAHLEKQGLRLLPWTTELRQWCARVSLLRSLEGESWPDLGEEALLAGLDNWLGPHLQQVSLLQDFKKIDLNSILQGLLDWQQLKRLEQLLPRRWQVPSGSSIAIDYSSSPPVLAVKLQEMFGCEQTPSLAGGRLPMQLHLLSPAGRPLQITQDLAGFWRSSYHEVKKDMKGRYPKHPWPDDPLRAEPTRKTRSRS